MRNRSFTLADDAPQWAKDMYQEIMSWDQADEIEKHLKTELKVVPEVFWKRRIKPASMEDAEAFIDEVKNDYNAFVSPQEKKDLTDNDTEMIADAVSYGLGEKGTSKTRIKPNAQLQEVKDLVKSIMP